MASLSTPPLDPLAALSLHELVASRVHEYTVKKTVRIKIGTWNVATLAHTAFDIQHWFTEEQDVSDEFSRVVLENGDIEYVRSIAEMSPQERSRAKGKAKAEVLSDGPEIKVKAKAEALTEGSETKVKASDIGLYVLGLQEMAERLMGMDNFKVFPNPERARIWKDQVADYLPFGYSCIAERQLQGIYILIFASPDLEPSISHVSTTSVGTGLWGMGGNKGGVAVRLVLDDMTRLLFVNCHLSAGVEAGNLEKRNNDASHILTKASFGAFKDDIRNKEERRELIGDEDFAFWFGDLNYRLRDIPGEDVRHLLKLHTHGEYHRPLASYDWKEDQSESLTHYTSQSHNLSPGPSLLQTTLASLLSHDELSQQKELHKVFHEGWREGKIEFLPTYKYDIGSVYELDSSEKKRTPSWCDRILYRTREDKQRYAEDDAYLFERVQDGTVEMKLRDATKVPYATEVIFDYDPETDGALNDDDQLISPRDSLAQDALIDDRLHLEEYKSHQDITSSDHKPVEALFTLTYDAVNADLKAIVYQEEARKLDQVENEHIPTITVDYETDMVIQESYGDASACNWYVEFGQVRYDVPSTRTVTVANTGAVPATMAFVNPADDGVENNASQAVRPYPSWITIRWPNGANGALTRRLGRRRQTCTIQPGEAITIEITILVEDADLANRLNRAEALLETDLVLRVVGGRDHYIPVGADWFYF